MTIPKEDLTDYKEVYEKAIKLVNEESKSDPPTDPYRSHYKARDLLLGLKKSLKDALFSLLAAETDCDGDDELKYKAILAFVCRDLGRIYVFTEETSTGEDLLQESLNMIENYKMLPEAIISHVGALNELGIVQAGRQEYKKAHETLSQSELAFKDFKESKALPLAITDMFGTPDEVEQDTGPAELESLYTLCTFYLAQVYGHLGELEKSAQYCHMTLCRQLEAKKYDPIDFALNAATLSQYYIGEQRFKEARHHLAAATLIMANYQEEMVKPEMTEQQRNDISETFKHRYADIARCWAKFGLCLLQSSKKRLFIDDDVPNIAENLAKATMGLQLSERDYKFFGLELSALENRISYDYCLTFDDAKLVFHFVNDWLDQAKEYYKAETEATEYAKIIKDYAECYELIAFFEEVPANQAKMHKKRAKYYEDLLELLNPLFYMNICRECWYGAGTAYSAVLDVKLDELKVNANPGPEELKKINLYAMKAIKNFGQYVKSYTEANGEKWRSNMDTEEQRTMLYAHFHLGRLHYKLITANPVQQLENLSNCLKYYKCFTTECEERKEASATLQGEIGVCREMVNLLPMKIANVKKRIS